MNSLSNGAYDLYRMLIEDQVFTNEQLMLIGGGVLVLGALLGYFLRKPIGMIVNSIKYMFTSPPAKMVYYSIGGVFRIAGYGSERAGALIQAKSSQPEPLSNHSVNVIKNLPEEKLLLLSAEINKQLSHRIN